MYNPPCSRLRLVRCTERASGCFRKRPARYENRTLKRRHSAESRISDDAINFDAGIVVLFGALAWAQQSGGPGTQQQESKPPVSRQLAPPAQPGAPVQTPQPQTGQSQPAPPPRTPQSQNPKQPGDTRSILKVRTNLVIVPVTVKDRDGQLVGDLQRDDFRVFCDDVEQKIVYFSSDPFPLSAVVLIDNDLSIKPPTRCRKV